MKKGPSGGPLRGVPQEIIPIAKRGALDLSCYKGRLRSSITSPRSTMAGVRAQPLSIESLLQKQKEEKEAAAKVHVTLSFTSPAQLAHSVVFLFLLV